LNSLKKKIEEAKGDWAKLLDKILWVYKITWKTSPFLLTYGTETVIPVEIECSSYRVLHFSSENNDKKLMANLIKSEAFRHRVIELAKLRSNLEQDQDEMHARGP